MSWLGIFVFAFAGGLILISAYYAVRLFYERNLKSFQKEIDEYLSAKLLEFQNIHQPGSQDWSDSPFKKPPLFNISLGPTIKIAGMYVSYNEKQYQVITAINKHRQEKKVWLEIETTLFKKPKLKFVLK
jgi:hypothetical protein